MLLASLCQVFPAWIIPLAVRLRLGRKLGEYQNVVQVSAHRIIKGPCPSCEYEALLYVQEHTTIPVPRVYRTYPAPKGQVYIEMELVPGANLAQLWTTLADDAKTAIMADLSDAVAQLRSLPPPQPEIIASASTRGALQDGRIGAAFGPFASHDTFHTFLRGGIPLETAQVSFGRAVVEAHSKHYKTHFTHGDLIPRNIVINNGRIAAIVDWGFAGWYPEYWEYTKTHFVPFGHADWYKAVGSSIPRYDVELVAERVLWERYDEPAVPRQYWKGGVEVGQH